MASISLLFLILFVVQITGEQIFRKENAQVIYYALHHAALPRNLSRDSTKIVGGQTIDISKVPWQVSLLSIDRGTHFCGGSIISYYRILTAGHCADEYTKDEVLVRIGSNSQLEGGYFRRIRSIIHHNEFFEPTFFNNDIAIMIVTIPIIFGRNIQPIALPLSDIILKTNDTVLVSGWGDLQQGDLDFRTYLHAVSMPIVDQELCKRIYDETPEWEFPVTENMFCAGILNVGGKDSCQVGVF